MTGRGLDKARIRESRMVNSNEDKKYGFPITRYPRRYCEHQRETEGLMDSDVEKREVCGGRRSVRVSGEAGGGVIQD